MLPAFDKILEVLLDIRALLYLAQLHATAQTRGQTLDQFAPDVDAAVAQARKRLEG